MSVRYSFVIPVLNERDNLTELARRLGEVMDALDGPCEAVIVDDGSTDGTFELLVDLHKTEPRLRGIRLSRNFGHQVAITAGLDHARGDAVIIMDGDLQDPPEVVLALAEKWQEGYQVVYAVRDERGGETRFKLATASWFYRLMSRMSEVPIPVDAGDFRLVDRQVVDIVQSMPEHRRYLRGMFAWVGFDQTGVHYVREARHAGKTKFSLRKMMTFAADGIVSFSTAPLRIALSLGLAMSVVSFGIGIWGAITKLVGAKVVPGWASLLAAIGLLGGVQLIVLGVMGEYVARIHDEVKRRPLYLVRDQIDSPDSQAP